jgi:hypothetical protein
MDTSGMKEYIGTKQIKAKLCTLQEAEDILGYPAGQPSENDDKIYLVEYKGGYRTWSPIEPFEKAYRQLGNFDFGMAIMLLKQGHCVARKGWNGKGMYLALQAGTTIPVENARGGAALAMANEGFDKIEICPHIDMRSADGKCVVGWLASQTDMLAEDWCIVGGQE